MMPDGGEDVDGGHKTGLPDPCEPVLHNPSAAVELGERQGRVNHRCEQRDLPDPTGIFPKQAQQIVKAVGVFPVFDRDADGVGTDFFHFLHNLR